MTSFIDHKQALGLLSGESELTSLAGRIEVLTQLMNVEDQMEEVYVVMTPEPDSEIVCVHRRYRDAEDWCVAKGVDRGGRTHRFFP